MDIAKIERETGWQPRETFASGLRKTIQWYLDNSQWVEHVTSGSYREWIDLQYATSSPAEDASLAGAVDSQGTANSKGAAIE
jgi:dTDP-glucose 4,6-dehydratase